MAYAHEGQRQMPRVILTSQHHRTTQDLLSQPGKKKNTGSHLLCVSLYVSVSSCSTHLFQISVEVEGVPSFSGIFATTSPYCSSYILPFLLSTYSDGEG